MRVATYYNNRDIRMEEKPVPEIGPGELLVKVHTSGICGSDVAEWYRTERKGKVLGHEIGGEIAKVGAGVPKWKEGDRVSASHHVPCHTCHFCKLGHHTFCDLIRQTNFDPGGFAEWVRLPAPNVRHGVYRLPKSVSFDEATFIEPLACTLRAQKKAGVSRGKSLLVLGSGVSGLLHVLLAKASGVERVMAADVQQYRLEVAKAFGADHVFFSGGDLEAKIRSANEGRVADIVILSTGATPAINQSLTLVDRGGTLLFFALNSPEQGVLLPLNDIFWKRGVTLMNSYAASPEDHRESLEWIESGRVNVAQMISHRLPFDRIAEGFDLVVKAEKSMKVIIEMSGGY